MVSLVQRYFKTDWIRMALFCKLRSIKYVNRERNIISVNSPSCILLFAFRNGTVFLHLHCLCLSADTLRYVGPFYLSKRYHPGGKCVTCHGITQLVMYISKTHWQQQNMSYTKWVWGWGWGYKSNQNIMMEACASIIYTNGPPYKQPQIALLI